MTKNEQRSVGFVGLGNMGEPMARNLVDAGFDVCVYNRTASRAEGLCDAGATRVDSPAAAAASGLVFTMLADDAAVEAVTFGTDGIAEALGAGGVHVSLSTIAPQTARRLADAHRERGAALLSAPVFGRPDAATARKLWICLAGDAAAAARARPALEAMGQGIYEFGSDPGNANVVKLAGNFLIISAIEALAESLALVEKNGIDRQAVAALFGETLFACPIYKNYGRIIANREYSPAGFRLKLGMKDLRLVRDAGDAALVPMALADLLHGRMLAALAHDRGDLDWTALELATAESAGLL